MAAFGFHFGGMLATLGSLLVPRGVLGEVLDGFRWVAFVFCVCFSRTAVGVTCCCGELLEELLLGAKNEQLG